VSIRVTRTRQPTRHFGNPGGLSSLDKVRTGEHFGVPVAGRAKEKERRDERRSNSDRKHVIAALFEKSGEIAPVDFRRFGTRAGEIIARAASLPRRKAL
jgi:hypothetical protein